MGLRLLRLLQFPISVVSIISIIFILNLRRICPVGRHWRRAYHVAWTESVGRRWRRLALYRIWMKG